MSKVKPILSIVVLLGALGGIAYYANSGNSEWAEFEVYSSADKEGKAFLCSDLIKTTVRRGGVGSQYSDDVIDYIYHSGYKFEACSAEIESLIKIQCESSISAAMNRIESGVSYWLGTKSERFCSDLFKEKISQLNASYQLPTDSSPFLLLTTSKETFLVNPYEISGVSFKENISSMLWVAEVETAQKVYRLLFSNKKQWEAAQAEFKTLSINQAANRAFSGE